MARRADAGLVPSEVVLVVNGSSLDSRTLANHYASLRNLPAANIIVLDRVPKSEVISLAEFRKHILGPLLLEMDRRKLGDHVQCIAYSADFPTAIDIETDIKPLGKLPIYFTSRASINALTFFYASVQANDPGYIQLNANAYARQPIEAFFNNPLGKLTDTAWQKIQEKIAAEEHKQAAELLVKMLDEYPTQFPVAYVAAAEYAQAGDIPTALDLLEKAVALGWSAGGYLKSDKRFDRCREESRFHLLFLSLDETLSKYQPAVGFDAKRVWAPNGAASTDQKLGSRYILSTVLGVTRGAGTTIEEAINNLETAAKADFTQPDGGFYFCLTSDVRTTTRAPGFEDAIATLREMGFEAEIVHEQLPQNKLRVLGAMIGTPNFDWPACGSRLLPGSIAENLTSVGAVMNSLGGQTKLTELIKAGAAGSSGTVTEPYSLQPKFPHPQMYVDYAQGLSLAESFYASVTGPYQLLIIGDPLCQPFAAPPSPIIDTQLKQLELDESLKFPLRFRSEGVAGKRPPSVATAISVLYDQAPVRTGAALMNVDVKLNDQPPGYHEVRLVCIGDEVLQPRSETVLPIWIGLPNSVTMEAPQVVSLKDRVARLQFVAQGAKQVTLWHESEQLASALSTPGEFKVPLEILGLGPIRLHVQAELESGLIVKSVPRVMQVQP